MSKRLQPTQVILSFEHPARAVDSVAEAMAHGLRSHGAAVEVLTLPRDLPALSKLQPQEVSGVISMGSLPLNARIAGKPLWEHLTCRFDVFLLDALPYDLARVPALSEFLLAALQDARLGLLSPEDGYRRWLQDALPVRWAYLPFGAFSRIQPFCEPVTPQRRLCVIGTVGGELGGSPVGESLLGLLTRHLGHRFNQHRLEALSEALLAPNANSMPAITVCQELGWGTADALTQRCLPTIIAVDSWVKRERRLAAVRSLAGIPCDFFGQGWKELLGEIPGFRHMGTIWHEDIGLLLPHYLGVVNFDPNWSYGVHDRVYTAAASGVCVLTNENEALSAARLPRLATFNANRPDLAGVVHRAGWFEDFGKLHRPDAEQLSKHGWATRMAQWIGSGDTPQGVRLHEKEPEGSGIRSCKL